MTVDTWAGARDGARDEGDSDGVCDGECVVVGAFVGDVPSGERVGSYIGANVGRIGAFEGWKVGAAVDGVKVEGDGLGLAVDVDA